MTNTNASPVMFGFDFQVNAAIFLMLENITELKKLRLEGQMEDIELTMNNGNKIFAQAKAVVKASSDFSNVRKNLKKAIGTLSNADSNDVEKLILITNSVNPLNEDNSRCFFNGLFADVGYEDLPDEGKNVIDSIVEDLGVKLCAEKFRIKFFRFETDTDKEKYKVIFEEIKEFVNRLGLGNDISSNELMSIWQNDILRNGTKIDTKISLNKEQIIWPVIVLAIGNDVVEEYLNDFDSGLVDEISTKYAELIDNCTERYELITQVIYDYEMYKPFPNHCSKKEKVKLFVDNTWKHYVDILALCSLDEELQEGIAKLVLLKIIRKRYKINKLKQGVGL